MRSILIIGALLGLLSVVFGAAAEHALRPAVGEDLFRQFQTALRYHQFGALVVTAVGLALLGAVPSPIAARLAIAGWLLIGGVLLFSFSIYLSIVLGMPGLTALTPVGGITLMLGWTALIWAALGHPSPRAR